MADLLNFNPNRELDFAKGRPLEFDPRRPLEFNVGRQLEFQPNRDLGFGHRGVVFRGYVCPICGSLVTEVAKRCSECGTVFDANPRAATPPASGPPKGAEPFGKPPKPASSATRPPGEAPAPTVYCAHCGVRLKKADGFCWNCGSKVNGVSAAAKLPSQKTQTATREWRGR